MYWPDGANTVDTLPPPAPPSGVHHFFQDTSSPGTIVTADYLNMVSEELLNCIIASGQTPNKNIFNQLALAIPLLATGETRTQYAPDTGGANAIVVAAGSWPSGYGPGEWLLIKVAVTNTGATTLDVNSIGAAAVQMNGAALAAGALTGGVIYLFVYDGANFQVIGGGGAGGVTVSGPSSITLPGATSAEGTIGSEGWSKDASGLIKQWAYIQLEDHNSDTGIAWAFPTPFAVGVLKVRTQDFCAMAGQGTTNAGRGVASVSSVSTTSAGFILRGTSSTGTKAVYLVEAEGY